MFICMFQRKINLNLTPQDKNNSKRIIFQQKNGFEIDRFLDKFANF